LITRRITYIVRPGDTLFSISRMFNASVDDIVRENNIINPALIYPGMQLVIPLRGVLYTVRPGDTVYDIAMRFGVPYEAIIYANNLVYPYVIYPNTTIFIPGGRESGTDGIPPRPSTQYPFPPYYGYPYPPCYGYPMPCPPFGGYPFPQQPAPIPTPTPPSVPTMPEPGEYFTYTVKPGDTLYELAMLFCTTVDAIARANNIKDPNKIDVGQRLRIPVSEGRLRYYTVRPGDSLYEIAKRYNTTIESIAKANDIADPAKIYPGQRLVIIVGCKPDP
jgi:LysM domain.